MRRLLTWGKGHGSDKPVEKFLVYKNYPNVNINTYERKEGHLKESMVVLVGKIIGDFYFFL